jgi:hypothetical protein
MRYAFRAAALWLAVSMFQAGAHAASANSLFTAIAAKDLPELANMVERGADVNARNDAGQTPLMAAAMQGRSEKLIELLVFLGADLRARDKNGMTALMHAALKGEQDNAEQLLQLGIDPDLKDNSGKTVVDYARTGGLTESIGNRTSFISMLQGKNHKSPGSLPYSFYILYKPGTISAKEFEQAVVRALTRKGWGIADVTGSSANVFYARVKYGRLYKAEIILEPSRIVIRYRPGFGFRDDAAYLEGIRFGLMNELAVY